MSSKRRWDEDQGGPSSGSTWEAVPKSTRIDTSLIKELTLKKIMNAGQVFRYKISQMNPLQPNNPTVELILCEGCHKRAPPPESSAGTALVGECRFCSRRSLCSDCWGTCCMCGMEVCPLCSVKDYSGRETVPVCLDCKRHSAKSIVRR